MIIGRTSLAAQIPHQGAMCFWEHVRQWDEERIVLHTSSHRQASHPLRYAQQLHAVVLCEYAAQAMAVHGSLLAEHNHTRIAQGMLAALYDVALFVERIDMLPGVLEGHVHRMAANAVSLSYGFRMMHAEHVLATGRATVSLCPTA